jgi:hypothetical protein
VRTFEDDVNNATNNHDPGPNSSFSETFSRYYNANGPGFGSADVLCCGAAGVYERIALLAQILLKGDIRFLIVAPPHWHGENFSENRLRLAVQVAIRENDATSADLRSITTSSREA